MRPTTNFTGRGLCPAMGFGILAELFKRTISGGRKNRSQIKEFVTANQYF